MTKKTAAASLFAFAALLLFFSSCRSNPGAPGNPQTPQETLQAYLEAETKEDWGRLYDLEWKPGEREDFIETKKLLSSIRIKSFTLKKVVPEAGMSDFTGVSLREDEDRLMGAQNLSVDERKAELDALKESYSLTGAIVHAAVTYSDGKTFELKYFLIRKPAGWKMVAGLKTSP